MAIGTWLHFIGSEYMNMNSKMALSKVTRQILTTQMYAPWKKKDFLERKNY